MKKILISEIFYSIQGEGSRVGIPSIFVRVFGCNLNCPGFGQERGKLMPEEEMPHNKFDISSIDKIEDLPVFDVGCDSSASWSKRYRHLSKSYSVQELWEAISNILKEQRSRTEVDYDIPDIVITGGEPLLPAYQKFWIEFFSYENVDRYFEGDIDTVTFETNGTQKLLDEFEWVVSEEIRMNFDSNELPIRKIIFSVSPKLSISGEPRAKAIKESVLEEYMNLLGEENMFLKFVVRDEEDIQEIFDVVGASMIYCPVYLMPEGATDKGLGLTERRVAELAMKYGFRFSPRLQVNLFGNTWGT